MLPKGARYIEYDSGDPWAYEVDSGQADGDTGTAAEQQSIAAGTGSMRCPGSGAGRARLPAARSIFVAGTTASQTLSITVTRRGV